MEKVLFYIPPDKNNYARWDGQSIRSGGHGASGSHQSTVVVAEQFIKQNIADTVLVYNFCNDTVVKGVRYIKTLDSAKDIDTLIVPSWFATHNNAFEHIKSDYPNIKNIIIWFHCPFLWGTLIASLININFPVNVSFVHLSTWSKNNVFKAIPANIKICSNHFMIPNALMSDCLPIYNVTERPNDAVFFACFERGGEVSERVWKLLKQREPHLWGKFTSIQYTDKSQCDDKISLFSKLNNARYFVYPLVLPPGSNSYSVHRDTFGCCVAEAIANGVEVLSYPVGALGEHFEDMIHWIPFPKTTSKETINESYNDIRVPEMFGDVQVEVIASMLKSLNDSYESRSLVRQQNANIVKARFDMDNIGRLWKTNMQSLQRESKPIEINRGLQSIHHKNRRGLLI